MTCTEAEGRGICLKPDWVLILQVSLHPPVNGSSTICGVCHHLKHNAIGFVRWRSIRYQWRIHYQKVRPPLWTCHWKMLFSSVVWKGIQKIRLRMSFSTDCQSKDLSDTHGMEMYCLPNKNIWIKVFYAVNRLIVRFMYNKWMDPYDFWYVLIIWRGKPHDLHICVSPCLSPTTIGQYVLNEP